MIRVEIETKLPSCANERGHWKKTSSAGGKRKLVKRQMELRGQPFHELPASVRLTRVAPRPLDGDNLQRAMKAVRDGVADWLGVDDRDERVRWFYAQAVDGRPRYQAARIEVVPWHDDCGHCGQWVWPETEAA